MKNYSIPPEQGDLIFEAVGLVALIASGGDESLSDLQADARRIMAKLHRANPRVFPKDSDLVTSAAIGQLADDLEKSGAAPSKKRKRKEPERCIDCGKVGALHGHMDCPYPGQASAQREEVN